MPAISRQPISITRKVNLLVDPTPQLVSLVPHGANQTPFLTIKAHTMSKPAAPAPTVAAKGNDVVTEIHKIVFPAAKFATEGDVTTYLASKGFSGGNVEAVEGGGFVVKGIDEAAFKSFAPVTGDDGVIMFVGELATPIAKADNPLSKKEGESTAPAEEPPATEEAPAAPEEAPAEPPAETPAAEPPAEPATKGATPAITARSRATAPQLSVKSDKLTARKVDTWMAYYDTNDVTIAGVLADANDGIPVGFCDIENAFIGALKNLVLSGKTSGIKSLCSEFGEIIVKLATLTAGVEKADERAEAVKSLFGDVKTLATKAAPGSAEAVTLETLAVQLKTISAELVASRKEAKEAKEAATKANDRATSLEQIRQTRKSAEHTETAAPAVSPSTNPPPAQKSVAAKMAANAMGI